MQPLARGLGRRIRRCREAAHLTQEELSERAMLHPTYVGYIERGQRLPSLRALERLADALSVPLATLLKGVQ
ncbi:MAG: helix-turn-helix transcriptional regulator [Elusimicrobia bacterium]|nr:helix-turn-helix transcriptional regulator [Elusimicrobiota bacterium]